MIELNLRLTHGLSILIRSEPNSISDMAQLYWLGHRCDKLHHRVGSTHTVQPKRPNLLAADLLGHIGLMVHPLQGPYNIILSISITNVRSSSAAWLRQGILAMTDATTYETGFLYQNLLLRLASSKTQKAFIKDENKPCYVFDIITQKYCRWKF